MTFQKGNAVFNKLPANTQLKGVGGWLLLLIFLLAFYTPVMEARNLYYEFIVAAQKMPVLESNPAWVRYRMMVWIVFGIMCALCFAAGYGLWKIHKPMSVQLAIGVIWLVGPFVPVIYSAMASAIFNMEFMQAVKPFLIVIFSATIQSVIWTGYLLKSVRVKNTYYS